MALPKLSNFTLASSVTNVGPALALQTAIAAPPKRRLSRKKKGLIAFLVSVVSGGLLAFKREKLSGPVLAGGGVASMALFGVGVRYYFYPPTPKDGPVHEQVKPFTVVLTKQWVPTPDDAMFTYLAEPVYPRGPDVAPKGVYLAPNGWPFVFFDNGKPEATVGNTGLDSIGQWWIGGRSSSFDLKITSNLYKGEEAAAKMPADMVDCNDTANLGTRESGGWSSIPEGNYYVGVSGRFPSGYACRGKSGAWQMFTPGGGSHSFLDDVTDFTVNYVLPLAAAVVGTVFGAGIGGVVATAAVTALVKVAQGKKLSQAVIDTAYKTFDSQLQGTAFYESYQTAVNSQIGQAAIAELKKGRDPDVLDAIDHGVSVAQAKQVQDELIVRIKKHLKSDDERMWLDLMMNGNVHLKDWIYSMYGDAGVALMNRLSNDISHEKSAAAAGK